ncbi:MAG TPA: biotin-dependent carboxyltransferase family protein [Pyrinomonadaceae bacterium]|jgi:antagonist of KipI
MSLFFLKSGILTTVQDLGRNGFRRFGINPNGAMDRTAARLLNVLLGNDETEALLETHFPAPEILFEENAVFAVGGADFGAKLSGAIVENWKPHYAQKGDVLKFTAKVFGNRAYLSIRNGFRIEKRLGSASTNLTAQFGGAKMQKDDRLFFKQTEINAGNGANFRISDSLIPFYSRFPIVRAVAGAEFESLTAHGEQTFRNENFVVTPESDRMGFRLRGKSIFPLEKKELVSSAVNFGTVQLLPDGQLIVLMADAPTSGGYPRLAHVIEADLPLVAQLGAGDKIAFHLISQAEAENIFSDFEKNLHFLKIGVSYSSNLKSIFA